MVQTFKEWKAAVTANRQKLAAVEDYLNDAGKERLEVFLALEEITEFAADAKDAIDTIEEVDGLIFDSPQAAGPIRALHRIAEQEGGERL